MREVGTPARVSWSAMASEESPCCACLSWARGGCSAGAGPGRPRQLPACQGRSRRGGALQWRPQTHSPPAGCAPPTAHSPPARWVPMSLKPAIYDFLLDPACGTGTFLYMVIEQIREQFQRAGNSGMWSSYVRQHLLPRLFGFELLMPPYAMAHLKLGMQLAGMDLAEAERPAWAYDFAGDERLGVYLTNTL